METEIETETEILIIGTGFGGLGMAIQLKEAGFCDFVLVEKAHSVWGCWRENSYPGAACDVPSHLYSFSFAPNPNWSRRFAHQAEIYAYLKQCAAVYNLSPHIRFGTEVVAAHFDETEGRWHLQTAAGATLRARVLIAACGQLSHPAWPDLPHRDRFAGKSMHSAQWDHTYDLSGKRVAVIGTGASAIQLVPEIAQVVGSLRVFQRSAPYILPKPDRWYSPAERARFARFPWLQWVDRGKQFMECELRFLGLRHKPLRQVGTRIWARHLHSAIADPRLRQQLTPDYALGCKRVLLSNRYYPTFNHPHVKLITRPVQELDAGGILTTDGAHHPVDAIIYATGFRASEFLATGFRTTGFRAAGFRTTEFRAPMPITGLGGQRLQDRWRDGADAYLGMTIHGFPNLYLLYGPNTNLGHNSIIYMLESQIRYIVGAVRALYAQKLRYMHVRAGVQMEFNRRIQAQLKHSIWSQGCRSWYQTAQGKQTNNWPGFSLGYALRTRSFRQEEYEISDGYEDFSEDFSHDALAARAG